jgi:hypothetical protein
MLVILGLSTIGLELTFVLVTVLLQLNLNKIKFNATKNIMEKVIVYIIENVV